MISQPVQTDQSQDNPANKPETCLFSNSHYALSSISLTEGQIYQGQTSPSFHHLFVESGAVEITSCADSSKKLKLQASWSAFCPACLGKYQIKALEKDTMILKTFI